MWNFLVSRKGTISNAWFFPPWRPEFLTSQQIKSVEIRKTVFLQYDECLALQQIKSIKARKTPCEEIFVFSLTEVLVPSIETLMFNFSWLRFSEKAQMKRWQILASVPSRQMIAYIYTTESLTAKRFYINLISLILFKLDCSQNTGILFRRSAEDLKSFNIWQVWVYQLHQIIKLTSGSDMGKAWSFSSLFSCPRPGIEAPAKKHHIFYWNSWSLTWLLSILRRHL